MLYGVRYRQANPSCLSCFGSSLAVLGKPPPHLGRRPGHSLAGANDITDEFRVAYPIGFQAGASSEQECRGEGERRLQPSPNTRPGLSCRTLPALLLACLLHLPVHEIIFHLGHDLRLGGATIYSRSPLAPCLQTSLGCRSYASEFRRIQAQ